MLIILLCILHKLHTLNRICIFIFIIYVRMSIFTMRNNVLKIDQASWDIRDTEYIRLHTLMATSTIITMEWWYGQSKKVAGIQHGESYVPKTLTVRWYRLILLIYMHIFIYVNYTSIIYVTSICLILICSKFDHETWRFAFIWSQMVHGTAFHRNDLDIKIRDVAMSSLTATKGRKPMELYQKDVISRWPECFTKSRSYICYIYIYFFFK